MLSITQNETGRLEGIKSGNNENSSTKVLILTTIKDCYFRRDNETIRNIYCLHQNNFKFKIWMKRWPETQEHWLLLHSTIPSTNMTGHNHHKLQIMGICCPLLSFMRIRHACKQCISMHWGKPHIYIEAKRRFYIFKQLMWNGGAKCIHVVLLPRVLRW